MGNVGVPRYRPLKSWLVACCMFFDQWFLRKSPRYLSTDLLLCNPCPKGVVQPVDNSVGKLWKDRREQRSYWPGATPLKWAG
ncbi:hypothetical protein CCU68_16800 [Pseudomonas gingeri NCPPB 3146 = LMG 5327]|uniref:Uncharacterized protein n=1 Tax=Pseudomonas gingeri NCPPB 3146 = LMG 5327 TaxID=707248 RepID=A0ABX4Y2K5_9PSED|nr:hypothetical protein CCU68_16800 [Pseudomonas gingeri NCPPB 3146 = LMG 5327]